MGVQPQGRRRRRKKFDTPVDEFGVPVTPALTEGAFVEDTEEVVTAVSDILLVVPAHSLHVILMMPR